MAGIVSEFVDGLMARFAALAAAHESADLEQVAKMAHQLKGSGGGYGYPAVTSAAAKVEQLARQPNAAPEQCIEAINELKLICRCVVAGQIADEKETPLAATVHSAGEGSFGSGSDGEVPSLIRGGESRLDTIQEIEELASTDPEWMKVSDILQNLPTILRQSSASELEFDAEDVESNADTGSPVVA